MKHINVGLSIHRPEIISKTSELMEKHDIIFLEEPPAPNFIDMLNGTVNVEDYLMPLDLEYPEFSRQMCCMEKELYAAGKTLIQVEPFYEVLLSIHDFFACCNEPTAIKPNTLPYYVFKTEKHATGALLNFYKASAAGSFDAVVEAVRQFARADAARFRLRDSLRAQEIIRHLDDYSAVYVEAGMIHYFLWRELRRLLPDSYRVQPIFLNRLVLPDTGSQQHLYSQGDQLTLFYIFHPRQTEVEQEELLAARSIIYSKIIHKEENNEDTRAFFHITDEMNCIRLVNKLSAGDCRRLYARIRQEKTARARRIVTDYVAFKKDSG